MYLQTDKLMKFLCSDLDDSLKVEQLKLFLDGVRDARLHDSCIFLVDGLINGPLNMDLSDEEVAMAANGEFIEAVKMHRIRTGAGIRDAKEKLERAGFKYSPKSFSY